MTEITLTGRHQQTNLVPVYVPPPRDVRLNEHVVPGVMPSLEPQVWQWPMTELPSAVQFGIGAVSHIHHNLLAAEGGGGIAKNHRVLNFVPERAELELEYWVHTPLGGAHAIEWRIIGQGTIVPEPSVVALALWCAVWVTILWRKVKKS
jgi:hypothetical protein